MKGSFVSRAAMILACGLVLPAWSAEAPASTQTQDVVVEGKPLRVLRAELRKTERRFQTLYGRYNRDTQQRISCDDDAATGSRFTKRKCTTLAAENATAQAAQDYVATADLNASTTMTQTGLPAGATRASAAEPVASAPERYVAKVSSVDLKDPRDSYRQNLENLMEAHPDLRQAFEEYAQARAAVQAAEKGIGAPK
jgi:hypothetical protein